MAATSTVVVLMNAVAPSGCATASALLSIPQLQIVFFRVEEPLQGLELRSRPVELAS